MLETTDNREFRNETIPGIAISVNGDQAFIVSHDPNTFGDSFNETVHSYTQEQIREYIGLLLNAYEYMEENKKDDDQMTLFDEDEEDEITEEVVVEEFSEPENIIEEVEAPMGQDYMMSEYAQLVGNATSFLMIQEDFSNNRISKHDVTNALHILRDSIDSYLEKELLAENEQENYEIEQRPESE